MSHTHQFASTSTAEWPSRRLTATAGSTSSLATTSAAEEQGNGYAPGTYYGAIKRTSDGQTQLAGSAGTVRQHQQNVQVVNVPEARKFFASNAATRLEVCGKLHLNSLLEYIDHLEAYRRANHDKIGHFTELYYSMLKGGQVGDTDGQADSVAAMNGQVKQMLVAIEKKLEACQLKRVMNNDLESMFNQGATQTEQEGTVQMKIGGGEESGEAVEIIDLTYRDEKAAGDDIADKATGGVASGEQGRTTSPQELNVDGQKEQGQDTRDELLKELQSKLRELELQLGSQELNDEKKASEVMDLVPAWTSSGHGNELASAADEPAEQLLVKDAKICLGGHELPLPKAFNRLAQVEKNLLICQLPESLRGQYLNMCWESRFYEQMAKAPSSARQQLLRARNL